MFFYFAGTHSNTVTPDEAGYSPRRRRTTSEGQYNSIHVENCDAGVRSPRKCVSQEFVSTIAMNPKGRPNEVKILIELRTFIIIYSAIELQLQKIYLI